MLYVCWVYKFYYIGNAGKQQEIGSAKFISYEDFYLTTGIIKVLWCFCSLEAFREVFSVHYEVVAVRGVNSNPFVIRVMFWRKNHIAQL